MPHQIINDEPWWRALVLPSDPSSDQSTIKLGPCILHNFLASPVYFIQCCHFFPFCVCVYILKNIFKEFVLWRSVVFCIALYWKECINFFSNALWPSKDFMSSFDYVANLQHMLSKNPVLYECLVFFSKINVLKINSPEKQNIFPFSKDVLQKIIPV